jgi:hypothetical protein
MGKKRLFDNKKKKLFILNFSWGTMKKSKFFISHVLIFQVISLLFLIWQCGKRSDSKQLDEKVFVQAYCDIVIYADLVDSKRKEALVDSVLNSYKISQEQFQYTMNAYSNDEKKWEELFTKIVAELERREKELTTKSDSTKMNLK